MKKLLIFMFFCTSGSLLLPSDERLFWPQTLGIGVGSYYGASLGLKYDEKCAEKYFNSLKEQFPMYAAQLEDLRFKRMISCVPERALRIGAGGVIGVFVGFTLATKLTKKVLDHYDRQ